MFDIKEKTKVKLSLFQKTFSVKETNVMPKM